MIYFKNFMLDKFLLVFIIIRLLRLICMVSTIYPPPHTECIDVVNEKKYRISCCEAQHGIPAFSYCFEENERSGVFYPEKAKELGIPEGKMWQELQNGNSVEVNGVKIDSSQVTGDKRPGKKIGISGDTRPTEKLQNFFNVFF